MASRRRTRRGKFEARRFFRLHRRRHGREHYTKTAKQSGGTSNNGRAPSERRGKAIVGINAPPLLSSNDGQRRTTERKPLPGYVAEVLLPSLGRDRVRVITEHKHLVPVVVVSDSIISFLNKNFRLHAATDLYLYIRTSSFLHFRTAIVHPFGCSLRA